MYQLKLGPFEATVFSGDNWSNLKVGFWTDRGTAAEMFTGLKASVRSDHALAAFGADNPDDVLTIEGVTYTGKIAAGLTTEDSSAAAPHVLTAHQQAARAIRAKRLRDMKQQAAHADNILLDQG